MKDTALMTCAACERPVIWRKTSYVDTPHFLDRFSAYRHRDQGATVHHEGSYCPAVPNAPATRGARPVDSGRRSRHEKRPVAETNDEPEHTPHPPDGQKTGGIPPPGATAGGPAPRPLPSHHT